MSDKQIIHYGSYDRGPAVVLGEGLPAVYFGTTPVPFENDVIYIASLDISKEIDRKRRDKLEQCKDFLKGKIRYIPSQAELEAIAKKKAQDEACEAMKRDLESGLYTLNLEGLKHVQLMELGDKIGAKTHSADGRAMSPLALRNGIAGRLGLTAPHTAPVGNRNAAKDKLPDVSDVVEEKPKPPKNTNRKRGK